MRLAASALVIAAGLWGVVASAAGGLDVETSNKAIALTFDDLPYASVEDVRNTIPHARRVTDAILAVLEEYDAPATAFVNEAKLYVSGEFEERRALLKQWVDAGVILGNHTFSHADLNVVTTAQFKQEIIKGENVTRVLMRPHEPYQRYFRHPYTHTGNSKAEKEEIDRFLLGRGYKVAPFTVDSQDHVFNVVYLHRKEQGDDVGAMEMCHAYTDFVSDATEFAENISVEIFGHNIPQTLVLHANDVNADCLARLLEEFNRRGYAFVSLETVMSHPAYQTRDTFVTAYGPSWLWRWMKSKGMNVSFRDDPEPPDWVTALHQRVLQTAREK